MSKSYKELQFELWTECNSRCKYCYLGEANLFTSEHDKISMMQKALDTISDLTNYTERHYDTISYLGGEFFQGQINTPAVREKWFELMDKTAWLQNNGYIKTVWMYATMTIGNQKDLYETLERFDIQNKDHNFWILTSYDTIGRFHSPKMEETWKFHMHKLHEMYPKIEFNITTIMTGDLIDKYLNNQFSFKDMMKEYNALFFLKHCGRQPCFKTNAQMNEMLPNFFPTRSKFLQFLQKFKNEESEEMWSKLFDIKYRADTLYRYVPEGDSRQSVSQRTKNGTYDETCESQDFLLPCGHMNKYQAYVDSDKCILCDKLTMDELQK